LGRCKNKDKTSNKDKPDTTKSIKCICLEQTENKAMVQCEKCRNWSHSDCVQEADPFYCASCEPLEARLIQGLLEETSPLSSNSSPEEQETSPEHESSAEHESSSEHESSAEHETESPFEESSEEETSPIVTLTTPTDTQEPVWDGFNMLEESEWMDDDTWTDLPIFPPTLPDTLEEPEPPNTSKPNTPADTTQDIWFQFANFDDDYQCE
jgi:hypothetical protein